MNNKKKIGIGFILLFLVSIGCLNFRFEIIAINPLVCSSQKNDSDFLKVMTWNVHCPNGTDRFRQVRIADLILSENADFLLLNEYNQDSCSVIDSLLKERYVYTEESQSHKRNGDIFYSKRQMSNSGHQILRKHESFQFIESPFPDSLKGKSINTIKATIPVGLDSVQILGLHMMCNSCNGSSIVNGIDSLIKMDVFYERYKNAQEHRIFQAQWTKEMIKESSHAVIVMGDFNDFNCSAPLDTFMSCGMKDSWWEGGLGYGCTFHSGWMRLRIDHILHSSQLKLKEVKVIETDLSDHNPLVASFYLDKKKKGLY